MGLFANKSRSYLGVDLGSYNIKLVELENQRGRPKLVTYGFSDRITEPGSPELIENIEETVAELKALLKSAKVRSRQVIAALPVSAIFTSIVNITNLRSSNDKELEEAIKSKAKKIIPLPLDEMIIYHNPLETKVEKVNGNLPVNRFLLTAAPKELVKKYLEIFKRSGLNILSLETESFALSRSLVGSDRSAVMIVDLGENNTNISVTKNGIPVLNRSIDISGQNFTKVFHDHLKIDIATAERFKRDLSYLGKEGELDKLHELFDNLVHEIHYCFGLYQQENKDLSENIEKIILSGGSALLPALDNYLSSRLNIRVFIGDPWGRVIYPEDLKPVLDKVGPRMAIAVGLAMREIE
jgi:type IV pilus assembly protein PilM